MKKKIFSFITVFAVLLTLSGGIAALGDNSVGLANPITRADSYKALCDAHPDIKINDAPAGSEDVSYSWISNIPVIAQVDFTYGGHSYTYRASVSSGGAISSDISGVYSDLPSITNKALSRSNYISGGYILRYDTDSGEAVSYWYSELNGCQYTLHTGDGCKGSTTDMEFVMDMLYVCAEDVQNAKGTVQGVNSATLVLQLEDGKSVVLDRSRTDRLNVSVNDTVDFSYRGDLSGVATLVGIVKTGTGEADSFEGYIVQLRDGHAYICSMDGNVFNFVLGDDAEISGVESELKEGQYVRVSFSGDVTGDPAVKSVEVLEKSVNDGKTSYILRDASGKVTSVSGDFVTVNGICLDIKSGNCYVSGAATVGADAAITFHDYGSHKCIASAAYFTPAGNTGSKNGTVNKITVSGSNYYFTVGGIHFYMDTNTANTDGTLPTVDGSAYVEYRLEDGIYKVSYAKFKEPPKIDNTLYYYIGTLVNGGWNADGSVWLSVDGVNFIGPSTIVAQIPGLPCTAEIYYTRNNNVNTISSVKFSPYQPTPTPAPTVHYINGTVYATAFVNNNLYINVDGVILKCSPYLYSNPPQVGDIANISYIIQNGENVVQEITFNSPLPENPAIYTAPGPVIPNG